MTTLTRVAAPTDSGRGAWAAGHRAERARVVLICSVLAALALALFMVSMMLGSYFLNLWQVVTGALGVSTEPSAVFVVRELRLPRALAAILVGFALGVSGTLFQRLLGNPLASPDILGVSSGAGAAAVAGIVFFGLAGLSLAAVAVVGATATAAAMMLIAARGGLSGYRFILVGIGLAAMLGSAGSWILSRAEVADAREATTWLIGSVGMAEPAELTVLAIGIAALLPCVSLLTRRLRALELGDDSARSLGASPMRDRIIVMSAASVLVALATAASGPIAFVALMAGPIAAAAIGRGQSVIASGLVGVLIVQVADIAAQHALPVPLSTGVVTGFIGAPYIVWLIVGGNRKETAG
ncbi:FecCD family ABC transporter permease [Agromyces albus]|uniref:Iron ABC transporter permease n=1 Tax=Agromyces albus TaxID=205332 RepID=A0A4Q2KYZ2_9MICO|nr:iron chelate uptake ABC transporter family permease subunit [Agromyces albus]RXZ70249.1 iron ABC transporter permease [Agromyces albus]